MNIWRTAEKNRAERLKKSAEIRCQKKRKSIRKAPLGLLDALCTRLKQGLFLLSVRIVKAVYSFSD